MTVTKEQAMQMFDRDLEILMDDLRGMQAHYKIADWEAFVFLRKPDHPESYVVEYAAADDAFATQIVQLHAATPPDTPVVAAAKDAAQEIAAIYGLGHQRGAIAAIITRHFAATPVVARELISRLIKLAAAVIAGHDFISPYVDDNPKTTPRAILDQAEKQRERLRLWAIEIREVADKLSAATTSPSEDYPYPPCAVCGHFGMVVPVWVCTYHDLSRIAATSPSETAVGGEPQKCVKCGHFDNDPRRRGSDAYSSFCIYGCGCACEFTSSRFAPLGPSRDVNVNGWCDCVTESPWFDCGGCGDEINLIKMGADAVHWQGRHWHIRCAFQAALNLVPAAPVPDVGDGEGDRVQPLSWDERCGLAEKDTQRAGDEK